MAQLWPSMAETFGVERRRTSRCARQAAAGEGRRVGPHRRQARPAPIKMADLGRRVAPLRRFLLRPRRHQAAPAAFVSTIKIKQAGFSGVWDTEESFRYWLQDLIDHGVLPAA